MIVLWRKTVIALSFMALLSWLIVGCRAGNPQGSELARGAPLPRWLTFQLREMTVLADRSDGGDGAEFQLFIIATDGYSSAKLVYPAEGFIPIEVGQVIPFGRYGLSLDEQVLRDEVVIYVLAVDADELSYESNLIIDLLSTFVIAQVTSGASLVIDIAAGSTVGLLSDWIQEADVIGQKTIVLRRDGNWQVGEPLTGVADDWGFEIVYQVYLADKPGPGIPWEPTPVSSPMVQRTDQTSPAEPMHGWIAFVSDKEDSEASQVAHNLYAIRPNGTDLTCLTCSYEMGWIRYPQWSHDALALAFLARRSPKGGPLDLHILEIDGMSLQNLDQDRDWPGEKACRPSWSPDDRKIAFQVVSARVCMANRDGTDFGCIGDYECPAWSPDGRYIAVIQEPTLGPDNIWIVTTDGAFLKSVTDYEQFLADIDDITWAPDGEYLAFTRIWDQDQDRKLDRRSDKSDVFIVRRDGSGLRNLTNHPSNDMAPSWSPDGKWIVFASDRNGNFDIYVVRTDGTELQQVTNSSAEENYPSWAP